MSKRSQPGDGRRITGDGQQNVLEDRQESGEKVSCEQRKVGAKAGVITGVKSGK